MWTFGRDLVTTTGGLPERTTAALWVLLGAAAVLGGCSGDAVRLLGEEVDEVDRPAGVLESLGVRGLGARGTREPALVPHRDCEAGNQERRLPHAGDQLVVREDGVRREDLTIRPVAHAGAGACLGGAADDGELGARDERRERRLG